MASYEHSLNYVLEQLQELKKINELLLNEIETLYNNFSLILNFTKCNWVNLMLPSGTLWADKNIDAEKYFQWADTSGYMINERYFDWVSYKWSVDGSDICYSKYNSNCNTILDEDDACYKLTNGEAVIPTKKLFDELKSFCTWTWDIIDDIPGYRVTSMVNNNFIFLPALGIITYNSIHNYKTKGIYWSKTLHEGYISNVYALTFDAESIRTTTYIPRCFGLSIRPVKNKFN